MHTIGSLPYIVTAPIIVFIGLILLLRTIPNAKRYQKFGLFAAVFAFLSIGIVALAQYFHLISNHLFGMAIAGILIVFIPWFISGLIIAFIAKKRMNKF